MTRGSKTARWLAAVSLLAGLPATHAWAQPTPIQVHEPETSDPGSAMPSGAVAADARSTESAPDELAQYFQELAARRLVSAQTGSDVRLADVVREADALYLDGRFDEAALLLFEVTESPRFADFVDLPEFRGAEYMLAGALQELGAYRTAERYLDRILQRGPSDAYYAPAIRRAVDVALASGDVSRASLRINEIMRAQLAQDGASPPSEDTDNELRYLSARSALDAGQDEAADTSLADVTPRSRFYASAQYLRGAIAARRQQYAEAERFFCTIARQREDAPLSFYVDWRFFEVKDLARLALGRVAHEQGNRSDDAFYYYFQVPADSTHLPEALFEAAYAAYEGGDMETAIDLVEQLDTRFPSSPFVDEASVLRGYIHLSRCEFDPARERFQKFTRTYTPVMDEIDRVLANGARMGSLTEELLTRERTRDEHAAQARNAGAAPEAEPASAEAHDTMLALLRVDPAFYVLHRDIRTLDRASARAGRVAPELAAIAQRIRGDAPAPSVEPETEPDSVTLLTRDIEAARGVLVELTRQVDAMRRARATHEQLAPVEEELRAIATRIAALEQSLARTTAASSASTPSSPSTTAGLEAMLQDDASRAAQLPARARTVRAKLVAAADAAALRSLQALRERLGGLLRRARIGEIDAVMGSKRRIEIQIESLAAGRFPPELMDPLRVQGLLRDDEEYWPFEGELWPDEYEDAQAEDE